MRAVATMAKVEVWPARLAAAAAEMVASVAMGASAAAAAAHVAKRPNAAACR